MTPNPLWLNLCADNTITKEEYALVIEHLRQNRRAAAELSAIKRAQGGKRKRKKEIPDELGRDSKWAGKAGKPAGSSAAPNPSAEGAPQTPASSGTMGS